MTNKQVEVTDQILVLNVHTTISDNDVRQELLKSIQGVKHVKRLYRENEFQTPKELIQIEFISPKFAKRILDEGFINICNLRCRVKPIKPTMRLQNQLESNNGSNYSSSRFVDEQQLTDKILLHNVPTTITENDLGEKLSQVHQSIKFVKRWYYNNNSQTPMERVQIDFQSAEDTENILQVGFIKIGQLYCSVTPLKGSKRLQRQVESDYGSDYQSEIFTRDDEPITEKILLYDVPLTIDQNVLQEQLSKIYPGIQQIIRWCFDDDCLFPMRCLQIDFISSDYTQHILRHGFITNGSVSYKVKSLKSTMSEESDYGSAGA